jgi:triphosphoribosyl-dephospho-CoA synthase
MPTRLSPAALADALVAGARDELALTPKPGLVDRLDNGSHPDLSFDLMNRSIDLLPRYFQDLLEAACPDADEAPAARADLARCVEAGQRAERRMIESIGSNAHKGYIFLAGLLLLAAADEATTRDAAPAIATRGGNLTGRLRERVCRIADALAPRAGGESRSHGADARARHGLSGIHGEARAGLPAVFDRGLPALRRHGGHYAMAVLMQAVEDTTAVHRCGPAGLARLRADGGHLQGMIERREAFDGWLRAANADYRRLHLTMGGVADCLALTMALDRWLSEAQAHHDR